MKSVYIKILLFFWGFHFVLPYLTEELYLGENFIYSSYGSSRIGLWLNTIVILLTIILLPREQNKTIDNRVPPVFNDVKIYFWISILLNLYSFYVGGGTEGQVTGATLGTIFSYLNMFFSAGPALYFLFFLSKKKVKYPVIYVLVFLIAVTLRGSRSGVLQIVFLFLFMPMFSNYDLYKDNIKRYLKYAIIIGPVLFVGASSVRSMDIGSLDMIFRMIEGRISMIELSSIPLDDFNRNTVDWKLFDEKYGLVNQFIQSLNAISPYDFFASDVNPNQYYRSLFLGYSIEWVMEFYSSINTTIPTYWILETRSYIWGIIISVLMLLGYYKLMLKGKRSTCFTIMFLYEIYNVLYLFDFVMIVASAFSFLLCYFSIYIINKFFFSASYKRKSIEQ